MSIAVTWGWVKFDNWLKLRISFPAGRNRGVAVMRKLLILLSWLAVLPTAAWAQETRVGEPGFVSPSAAIADVEWLVGQWSGRGIGGADAYESWLPPVGGTMVGTFVQETAEGAIMFTEHIYLMEQGGSLVLKLKHFNPDLTGWEDKDGMVTFRLLAAEPCALYFNALTYRCEGDGGMVVSVRMKSDKPEPEELMFRFSKANPSSQASPCPDAMTTHSLNECFAERLARSDERRAGYFAKALSLNEGRLQLLSEMRASEAAFEAYREKECGAILADWLEGGGTLRTIFFAGCQIDLSDQRTHTIWDNWLIRMNENDPPFLPEPGPTP